MSGDATPSTAAAPRTAEPTPAWWTLLATGVIVLAVGVSFLPALEAGFVGWDDIEVLVENEGFRGFGREQLRWMFTTTHAGHYQPITWLTYALDWTIWGMNPLGYHLSSNLYHLVNALLVYLLSIRLLRRGWAPATGGRWWMLAPPALLSALLFAVHPLRVESVAWATERRDLVSAALILVTVLLYLRAAATTGRRRWSWMAACFGCYVVSMLAKVGGAPLPVVLLVLDWYPLRRLGGSWRTVAVRVAEKLPFLLVAVLFAAATVRRQADVYLVPYDQHGLLARVAQSFYGLVFYPWKTLLPFDLLPLYELHLPLDPFEPRFLVSAAIVTAVGAIVLALRRRWPAGLAAVLVYGAMLGPLLGFFQNGPQIVADRYSYLSCLPFTLLLAAAVTAALRDAGRGLATAMTVAAAGWIAALGALTWRQCRVWHSTASLWGSMIEQSPGSAFANNGWGCVLQVEQRGDEAIACFRRAIEIKPDLRAAWLNLWNALIQFGREDELPASYEAATGARNALVRAEAWFRLGNVALERGGLSEALVAYERSLAIRTRHAPTHLNAGLVLRDLGRPEEAETRFREAIRRDPELVNARLALADLLIERGSWDEAGREIDAVLRLEPRHAEAHALRRRLRALEAAMEDR